MRHFLGGPEIIGWEVFWKWNTKRQRESKDDKISLNLDPYLQTGELIDP